MKRLISIVLTAALLLGVLPGVCLAAEGGGMDHFKRNGAYKSGTFHDVATGKWYEEGVAAAYELGLVKGDNAGNYNPDVALTLREAVTLAARLHRLYTTGKDDFVQGSPWYQVYIDYAVEQGIIREGEFVDYSVTATRAQMAHIFAGALPADELPAINTVNNLPDVDGQSPYAADIFLLYRAGILTGNNSAGTFEPEGEFTRAQAAALIARMALPEQRRTLSLKHQEGQLSAAVTPLKAVRTLPGVSEIAAVDGVKPYGEHWYTGTNVIAADLSKTRDLAYSLTFSDRTRFPGEDYLPAGFDPEGLLEWGKDPGLNVDLLHEYGYTGKGAVIAYVDQAIGEHEQYDELDLHYINNSNSTGNMHGATVLSLLAGKDTGTAPGAEVYYFAFTVNKNAQQKQADCLYQIIELNKTLPEEEKITMVGFSDNIDSTELHAAEFRAAVDACMDAGIMVWFCGEYSTAAFLPMSDKNNPDNLTYNALYCNPEPELVFVPASGRTGAAVTDSVKYIYWMAGGVSWTMPYVLGLYAIVTEIDPSLTQDDLREMIVDTAYVNSAGMPIVNPVGFVAAALDGVGRTAEASRLRAAVAERTRYLYAVMDPDAMSTADRAAVEEYLSSVTGATVLLVDAGEFDSAQELYDALQKDSNARGGTVAGVQIFGTADAVPAFSVNYTAQMPGMLDKMGSYLTDLFYGNFNNDPALISNGYNVAEHFAEKWGVDLVPDWPVARLPLGKGEFTAFFEKYEDFAMDTGLEQPDLVNFSNPIFASRVHTDDTSVFLKRMDEEFGLLDVDYRLYGNLEGQYPVTEEVLGGFTKENVAKENDAGIMELLVNSHGQWNNIDQCIFVDGKEQRVSFLNMDNINSTLNDEPYYLDLWTCENGYGMKNNLTTTALNGQCVGVFSATAVISNNGVDCRVGVEKMKQSNFYYFYYSYLEALDAGLSRGAAFHAAQVAYAEALIADSANGIRRGEGNYQFNLNNLLAYHNFGVLESDFVEAGTGAPEEEPEPEKPAVQRPGKLSSAVKPLSAVRNAAAQAALSGVQKEYLYAVMDTAAMSKADLTAVGNYLAAITWANVLVADAASFSTAEKLYAELQADSIARGGTVAGVQIFGTAEMVPAFQVIDEVDSGLMPKENGYFRTDLFYGNFDNDAAVIAGDYSVYDHFEEGWDVDLVPDWPVARLPLGKGEFTAFFEKYEDFARTTGLEQQTLVNFSMPITQMGEDDMGRFLNEMDARYDLLDVDYRLYGNQEGSMPVSTQVLGGISTENLAKENDAGVMELLINTHGGANEIEEFYYTDGGMYRETLMNSSTINSVLDGNYYYLDCHTCLTGWGMGDNLTTAALNGDCVGVFSATHEIWVNGIDWCKQLPYMEYSDLRYFYYEYLKALDEGESRSMAFHAAQKAFAEELMTESTYGLRQEVNYQCQLTNLLAYHNFGVLEVDPAAADWNAVGTIAQAGQSVQKEQTRENKEPGFFLTDGNPVGEKIALEWTQEGSCGTLHSCVAQRLDNGYIRFTIDFTLPNEGRISVFDPPNGAVFQMEERDYPGGRSTRSFDLKATGLANYTIFTIGTSVGVASDRARGFYIVQLDGIW